MSEERRALLPENAEGQRLDKTLAALWPDVSRSRLQGLIEAGNLTLNGTVMQGGSHKVRLPSEVLLRVPPPVPLAAAPEEIPLEVTFEDAHVLVLYKPPGLVVHPAAGNWQGTLVNAVLAHCAGSLSGIGGVERPGIVHRLDKDTSGLMVVAKNDAAHLSLTTQFATRTVQRRYQALVWGLPSPKEGEIEAPIGRHPSARKKMAAVPSGKPAATRYRVVRGGRWCSLVACQLLSGRTHQVRVHLAHLGNPVVGDPVYGKKRLPADAPAALRTFSRQALHAFSLGFTHPLSGEELYFEREAPADMQAVLEAAGIF